MGNLKGQVFLELTLLLTFFVMGVLMFMKDKQIKVSSPSYMNRFPMQEVDHDYK